MNMFDVRDPLEDFTCNDVPLTSPLPVHPSARNFSDLCIIAVLATLISACSPNASKFLSKTQYFFKIKPFLSKSNLSLSI